MTGEAFLQRLINSQESSAPICMPQCFLIKSNERLQPTLGLRVTSGAFKLWILVPSSCLLNEKRLGRRLGVHCSWAVGTREEPVPPGCREGSALDFLPSSWWPDVQPAGLGQAEGASYFPSLTWILCRSCLGAHTLCTQPKSLSG